MSYAYFHQGHGWNQATRIALVRTIIEEGSLSIDTYHEDTGDKALVHGRYYSDKAPGASLAALLPGLVVKFLIQILDLDMKSHGVWVLYTYLVTLFVAGLPTALLGLALFNFLQKRRIGLIPSFVFAMGFGLATPAWAFATVFFGHALASCCLFLGFLLVLKSATSPSAIGRRNLMLVAGALLGWAVITELPLAPASLAVLALAAYQSFSRETLVPLLLSFTSVLVLLLTYNHLTFGSPFTLGYSHVVGFDGMKEGLWGVTLPRLSVLFEITFGRFRGLFVLAPFLLFSVWGFAVLLRRKEERFAAATALFICLYFFLFNAAYSYWNGGWSVGPRHVLPALPFLVWAAAVGAKSLPAILSVLLVIFGAGLHLMIVAVWPLAPDEYSNPIFELWLPNFLAGEIPTGAESPEKLPFWWGPWNLGNALGLRGFWSLLPLFMGWVVLLSAIAFMLRRRAQSLPAQSLSSGLDQ